MSEPYSYGVAITPSNTVDFTARGNTSDLLCDAIYIGGSGVVVVVFQDGTAVSFTCGSGQVLPVKAKRVNSTSTTATLMVALYDN